MEHRPGPSGRGVFLNRLCLGLVLGVALTATAGLSRARAEDSRRDTPAVCDERYRTLVEDAKRCLLKGDKDGAVESLIAARAELARCTDGTGYKLAELSPNL
jgi:hypothetical protein